MLLLALRGGRVPLQGHLERSAFPDLPLSQRPLYCRQQEPLCVALSFQERSQDLQLKYRAPAQVLVRLT